MTIENCNLIMAILWVTEIYNTRGHSSTDCNLHLVVKVLVHVKMLICWLPAFI